MKKTSGYKITIKTPLVDEKRIKINIEGKGLDELKSDLLSIAKIFDKYKESEMKG